VSIILGLNIPLPHLGFPPSNSLKSVLVLGGSSVVGSGAVQLLRQALPHAIILTTSSAQHHAHLLSLGATKCFERSVQENPSALLAATPTSRELMRSSTQSVQQQASLPSFQPSIQTDRSYTRKSLPAQW
jgi:hypothetical protein